MTRKPTLIDAAFEAEARAAAAAMERGHTTVYGPFDPREYAAGLPAKLPDHVIAAARRREREREEQRRQARRGAFMQPRRQYGPPGTREE